MILTQRNWYDKTKVLKQTANFKIFGIIPQASVFNELNDAGYFVAEDGTELNNNINIFANCFDKNNDLLPMDEWKWKCPYKECTFYTYSSIPLYKIYIDSSNGFHFRKENLNNGYYK